MLMTLAFAQHMQGPPAEPTSLYILSVTAGGGSAAMFLLSLRMRRRPATAAQP